MRIRLLAFSTANNLYGFLLTFFVSLPILLLNDVLQHDLLQSFIQYLPASFVLYQRVSNFHSVPFCDNIYDPFLSNIYTCKLSSVISLLMPMEKTHHLYAANMQTKSFDKKGSSLACNNLAASQLLLASWQLLFPLILCQPSSYESRLPLCAIIS